MKKVLSIDLKSQQALVGMVNQYGEVEEQLIVENDLGNLMKNLLPKVKAWLKENGYDYNLDIERIGVSVPGIVDYQHGIVKQAKLLSWKEYNLKKVLKKEFKNKKIYVLNNANAKALGEFWTGAATAYDSEIFYNLGQKVGGAIIMNDKLILGEHGFAGEFGHTGLIGEGEECECGVKNCFEPVASRLGFTKKLVKILEQNPLHPAHQFFSGQTKMLNFLTIKKIYQENNAPLAVKNLIKEVLQPLILHISTMVSAIDPKSVVIGGDIIEFGEDLFKIIAEEIQTSLPDFEEKSLVVKPMLLGKTAGIIGAAYYAINSWDE